MLKILQAKPQQCVNHELPDVQAGFSKGRGTRDQTSNICWIIKKERVQEKATTFALLTMPKPSKNWNIFKEMELSDHLTCLLRKLYANKEAIVRTRHETTDWFKIGKGVRKGCILSFCLFNICAEYT